MSNHVFVRAERVPVCRRHWDWLSSEQKAEIHLRRHCGEPTKSVAHVMGISRASVHNHQDLPRYRLPAGAGHDREKLRAKWRRKRYKRFGYEALRQKLWKYDLTLDDWDALFESHDHKCAICKSEHRLQVDHDHQTNQVRGVLCGKCNRALGLLGDSVAGLERALAYLRR